MTGSALQLPSELWTHVFGYLCIADKHRVRATCTYFKKLIDCGSLWKNWTVVLGFPKAYNDQFWGTLRRRKINSVVVRSSRVKDWKQLAVSLPSITTLVVDQSSQETLDCLKNFSKLKCLAVRCSSTSFFLDSSKLMCDAHRLTHLSVCNVKFPSKLKNVISTLSHFTNLTSLVCHETGISEEPMLIIHSILCCLAKLKHLSLTCGHKVKTAVTQVPPVGPNALTSLELIHCDNSLPQGAMELLPNLQTLVLVYKYSDEQIPHLWPVVTNLKAWLSDLHQLSSLVIIKGPNVHKYACFVPSTVTSLTLCVGGISSEEMVAVGLQVPNLLHLHIDPWPSYLGALTGLIPQLFPNLQSLKIRHEHVPKKDFLSLHKLVDLKDVEILDSSPQLSELAVKLQMLTDYRVQVSSSHQRDVLACRCMY